MRYLFIEEAVALCVTFSAVAPVRYLFIEEAVLAAGGEVGRRAAGGRAGHGARAARGAGPVARRRPAWRRAADLSHLQLV